MTALLAATAGGVARVSRADGAAAVERVLESEDVRALALDGERVFAGTDGGGVFASADGGRTWRPAGLRGERVRSLAARDGVVYAGTREPRVHVSSDAGGRWRPAGAFPRWRSWWWAQPAERPFRPSYVSALAIGEPGTVVAGIEACGVLRSADGGESWSTHRRRALRDCHELHAVDGVLYEAGSGGLALSRDDGRSWQRRRAGLDRRYGWSAAVGAGARYLTVAPYRAAHSGDSRARIVRARGDGPWEPCTPELPTLPRLAVDGDGRVFAALGDGTLLRSADAGRSWEPAAAGLGGWARALVALG